MPQLLRQFLLFVAFFVVVVTAWFSPKRYRSWCRAAVMVAALYFTPRSSFAVFVAWTLFCLVTAAVALNTSGALTVRSEWWRRYSDHKWRGRFLLSIDLAVAYVLFAILLLLTPVEAVRRVGAVMYFPVQLTGDWIVRLVASPPPPAVSAVSADTSAIGFPEIVITWPDVAPEDTLPIIRLVAPDSLKAKQVVGGVYILGLRVIGDTAWVESGTIRSMSPRGNTVVDRHHRIERRRGVWTLRSSATIAVSPPPPLPR